MKGKISEIFDSIQGEGVYLGQRQIFVRFFGCNLECSFCDTKISEYNEYNPRQLLSTINFFGKDFHSVSLTGGEPLLQKDFLKEVLFLIKQAGYRTYLETNGTLPQALEEVIADVDIVAMDIKLPSSTGIALDYWQRHHDFLKISSSKEVFIKVVICVSTIRQDMLTMLKLLEDLHYKGKLVLQPNSLQEQLLLKNKLEMFREMCAEHLVSTSIIPQAHKAIGVR